MRRHLDRPNLTMRKYRHSLNNQISLNKSFSHGVIIKEVECLCRLTDQIILILLRTKSKVLERLTTDNLNSTHIELT